MDDIAKAISDVAYGRVQRVAYPGLWRVYAEDGVVYYENLVTLEKVAVTTIVSDTDDSLPEPPSPLA